MCSKQELNLEPHGVFGAEQLSVIVVVLQSELRELARIKCNVRRNPCAFAAKNVVRIESPLVAVGVLSPQRRNPPSLESPQDLRVEAPIMERLLGQSTFNFLVIV